MKKNFTLPNSFTHCETVDQEMSLAIRKIFAVRARRERANPRVLSQVRQFAAAYEVSTCKSFGMFERIVN